MSLSALHLCPVFLDNVFSRAPVPVRNLLADPPRLEMHKLTMDSTSNEMAAIGQTELDHNGRSVCKLC